MVKATESPPSVLGYLFCAQIYAKPFVCVCVCVWMCVLSRFSRVRLYATLLAIACQASLCMGFSRQEYWSGLPCPFPGDFPEPGIEPMYLTSPALAGRFFTTSATWEAPILCIQ